MSNQKLNISQIHIGDILCSKDNIPMNVVAVYQDGTVFLRHESNPESLRFDIKDLHRHWNTYEELEEITRAELWERR